MSADFVVDATRIGWLTLAFMMLLSRVVFQAMGPVWMRSFLNGWQHGSVKQLWGAATLVFAAVLLVGAVSARGGLGTFDAVLLVGLLAILVADGLVNVLPGSFATFKDRMQRAWVSRRGASRRGGDRSLFGTVNAALAVASIVVAAVVISYRSIATGQVVLAAALAAVLTTLLIGLSRRTG
jgi:hypothetical protein